MKAKAKMTISKRRTEIREIEAGVKQTYDAFRSVCPNHFRHSGKRAHNYLHEQEPLWFIRPNV